MTEAILLLLGIAIIASAFAIIGLQIQVLRNRQFQAEMNRAFNEIHEKQIELNTHLMSNITTTEVRIGMLELEVKN